ncbi:ABC transporter substrate-binding protein [Amnibacterium soli]|uniref:ABC transporter substrate-binding protein n=1 Tax=Amnibacterium soli TaxID=1282736 RepID=A0ABP8Z2P2_9MICO
MSISRRGLLGSVAVAAGLALGLAGCAGSDTLAGSGSSSSSEPSSSASGASKSLTVGSANFPENVTLAYIYGGALEDKGYDVTYKVNIGARDAYLAALKSGEINLVPEYAGSLLSYLDKTANAKSGDAVKSGIDAKIGTIDAVAYDFASAADSDSLNVTKSFADKNSLSSIADLKKLDSFTVAANPEFATRADGIKGLKSVYGLDNLKFKAISDGGGPKTLSALLNNTVQVADIYSTTPSIIENKLVTLKDPKNLFASQQVVPIVGKAKASDDVATVLNSVSSKLTTDDLLKLNQQVSGSSKTDPQAAAKAFLKEKGL